MIFVSDSQLHKRRLYLSMDVTKFGLNLTQASKVIEHELPPRNPSGVTARQSPCLAPADDRCPLSCFTWLDSIFGTTSAIGAYKPGGVMCGGGSTAPPASPRTCRRGAGCDQARGVFNETEGSKR